MHTDILCMTLSPTVATIGYDPVLYTANETAGTVNVVIRLIQGNLTGLVASTAISVNVSAASFTATGLSVYLFVNVLLGMYGVGCGGRA